MYWTHFLGALLSAFLIGAVFFYAFKYSGPWGKSWAFILVLLAGIWFLSAVANPMGPIWYGVAWVDYLLFGLIIGFLLYIATPTRHDRKRHRQYYTTTTEEEEEASGTAVAIGMWFWILILGLIIGSILLISF